LKGPRNLDPFASIRRAQDRIFPHSRHRIAASSNCLREVIYEFESLGMSSRRFHSLKYGNFSSEIETAVGWLRFCSLVVTGLVNEVLSITDVHVVTSNSDTAKQGGAPISEGLS
jgi:hypothetical protein